MYGGCIANYSSLSLGRHVLERGCSLVHEGGVPASARARGHEIPDNKCGEEAWSRKSFANGSRLVVINPAQSTTTKRGEKSQDRQ